MPRFHLRSGLQKKYTGGVIEMNPFSKNYTPQIVHDPVDEKRRKNAMKGRETSAANGIGWGDGNVHLAGTPKHLPPGNMNHREGKFPAKLLAWYQANPDEYLSYEDICTKFGVTRKVAYTTVERLKELEAAHVVRLKKRIKP